VTGAPERVLEVQDIYTAYGLSQVLFGVSIQVTRGECVCLLGRNGVGKTTTMRSIIGLTPPRRGRVVWKGRDVTGRPPYQIARAGIGFIPEDRRIFADLTVWENLDVASRGGGPGGFTMERVFDLFPKLRELVGRQGGFLSGGEQQMLTIARTLMGNPELLLLDEPATASRSCSPSRTWASRSTWPTGSTCSRRATFASKAPRASSATTTRSASSTWRSRSEGAPSEVLMRGSPPPPERVAPAEPALE
jgi:ABC-type branched-subunit amino acid transport system ATPase component